MAVPLPSRRWLLVGQQALISSPGRSLLTFLVDGSLYRRVVVWGDPPADRVVFAAGNLMVEETDARPHGVPEQLTSEPPPPEPSDAETIAEQLGRQQAGLERPL